MRTLKAIFGSKSAERVLLYMQNYGAGYGREIAATFEMPVSQVGKQLEKLEEGGVLVSQQIGRVRLYGWNDRNPLIKPLRGFLEAMLEMLPAEETQAYYRNRVRPRKVGKLL